jgi:hypothetical protein
MWDAATTLQFGNWRCWLQKWLGSRRSWFSIRQNRTAHHESSWISAASGNWAGHRGSAWKMEFGIPINGFYGILEMHVRLGFEGQPFSFEFPCRESIRVLAYFVRISDRAARRSARRSAPAAARHSNSRPRTVNGNPPNAEPQISQMNTEAELRIQKSEVLTPNPKRRTRSGKCRTANRKLRAHRDLRAMILPDFESLITASDFTY